MVLFATHNFVKDPPFLISIRKLSERPDLPEPYCQGAGDGNLISPLIPVVTFSWDLQNP